MKGKPVTIPATNLNVSHALMAGLLIQGANSQK
jgi:hypothetical protein